MAGSPAKRQRRDRSIAVIEDVHSIDVIAGHVAGGGTLAEWCRTKDIHYTEINAWIQADATRRERYAAALQLRDTHHKDRVLDEINVMMQADIAEAYDVNGALLPVHDMPLSIRRAIASIEIEELFETVDVQEPQANGGSLKRKERVLVGYTKKIKLWDKVKGVELMARNQKMLTDKHEVAGKLTLADLLTELGGAT